jgi:hypothetical protein
VRGKEVAMNKIAFAVATVRSAPLDCVWVSTGNPAQPLECRWIPRRLAPNAVLNESAGDDLRISA